MAPRPQGVKAPAKPDAARDAAVKQKLAELKANIKNEVQLRRRSSLELREAWAKQAPPKRKLQSSAKGKFTKAAAKSKLNVAKKSPSSGAEASKGERRRDSLSKEAPQQKSAKWTVRRDSWLKEGAFATRVYMETQPFTAEGRELAVTALERKMEWQRKSSLRQEFPSKIKLRKPKFGKVRALNPESKGVNLMLKCVKIDLLVGSGASSPSWDVVCGDETGIVTFRLRDQKHADVCTQGATLRVQNARVLMLEGRIRVVVDKWGVMKAADSTLNFAVNQQKDVSATEYELVSR